MTGEREGGPMGRGPEDREAREARQGNAPGERGRGPITDDERAKINAARAAAGRDPLGADEEPDEQDQEVLDAGDDAPPSTPTAGV